MALNELSIGRINFNTPAEEWGSALAEIMKDVVRRLNAIEQSQNKVANDLRRINSSLNNLSKVVRA